MIYVGLDYHTKRSYVSILGDGSEKIYSGEMDSQGELPGFLRNLPDEVKVLFEAGYGWPRLVRLLKEVDVELLMCQPDHNRRIACDRRKSDRRDADNLAVYLKADTFKRAYMPDANVRDQRQLVRNHTCLRHLSTGIKNSIHSLLAYAGEPKISSDLFAKKNRPYLESVKLPPLARQMLDNNLEVIDLIDDLLKRMDSRIAELNRDDPRARFLKTIPGVGDFTARLLLAEIGDIRRFPADKALACYTGLTPRQYQSGDTLRTTGLTKEGSSHMRWALVQAAWVAVRLDPALGERFEKLRKEKGCGTAICAIARRLAEVVWHILTKQVPYRPQKPQGEGQPVVARGKPESKDGVVCMSEAQASP
jgi:transposase